MSLEEKKAKHHYPPAYYRYNERKPGIFIRLSKETKYKLDIYRGRMSYGEAIKKLLDNLGELDKTEYYKKMIQDIEKKFQEKTHSRDGSRKPDQMVKGAPTYKLKLAERISTILVSRSLM